jgi:hypothetical protein
MFEVRSHVGSIAHQLAIPSKKKRVHYPPENVKSPLTTAVLSDRGETMPITDEQVNAAQGLV